MIDIDLGFETEVSHLSQPLAVGFVHKRLFAGGKAFLGGKGLFGAAGAFLGAGKAPALPPGLVTTPGIPGGPGLTAPGVPGGGMQFATAGFGPTSTGTDPCPVFKSWNPQSGRCEFDFDWGPGTGAPIIGQQTEPGGQVEGQGIVYPNPTERLVQECPTMPNGKKGILWMGMQNGVVVCLPTGVNGKPMGYMRKNKPRRKAFISAAQVAGLRKRSNLTKKAKEFAKLTGQTCKPRGRGR